jgi:tetratricopeptide (TPR) repeat protein
MEHGRMQWQHTLPASDELPRGLVVVEADRGQSRLELLRGWTEGLRASGGGAWLLPCDVGGTGVFAGLGTLLEQLLPVVERDAPELLLRHAIELTAVLPALRSTLAPAEALTDTSVGDEAVRSYAVDRAYRIGHGIIDLLGESQRRAPLARWVLVCDDYDRSGALVRRFMRELARRRGSELCLTLVLVVSPGGAGPALEPFGGDVPRVGVWLDVPSDPPAPPPPAEMTARARELEERITGDFARMEVHIPELVRLWAASEHPERAHRWEAFALGRYNHRGYYEDALSYADAVLANLDHVVTGVPPFTRWSVVGAIVGCLILVGQAERARQVVHDEALAHATDPVERARMLYVLAMLHTRFLPNKDLELAEAHLGEALHLLESPGIAPETRHFLTVFMNNGVALVRHRQGRAGEALELCREGHALLSRNLREDRHRLERSVLLHNISQVYAATGDLEAAVEHLTLALEMDPNYSEFYNDRGNLYLRMRRHEDAIADYREAIRLSPPYPEVWTNLGQCYRKMGAQQQAVAAYSRAIDLDPTVTVALGSRAQVLDALGRPGEALADYDAALALDPEQPLLRANRAALRYDAGRLSEAVDDLDAAIALMPGNPGLYRNRALALRGLGRAADAARDLGTYLQLAPAAPDAGEVAQQIRDLEAEPAAA